MRYIVKHLHNGDIGVYDTEHGCYPNAGPELRAIGVKHIAWLRGEDGEAEAIRVCEALNLLDQGSAPVKGRKAVSKARGADGEAAFAEAAKALIEDEARSRANA